MKYVVDVGSLAPIKRAVKKRCDVHALIEDEDLWYCMPCRDAK